MTTHYGYGSGSIGCLYDNGPNYGGTSKKDVAKSALFIFEDELSEDEYRVALHDLIRHGVHYFPVARRGELGASVVEVFEVDPSDCPEE